MSRAKHVLGIAVACAALSCRGATPAPEEGPDDAPRERIIGDLHPDYLALPWTEEFGHEAVLVAERIRLVGPPGLRGHVAVRQEQEVDHSVRTVPEGLLQVLELQPGAEGHEIRANLDAWTLVAFERIEILERPFDVPVELQAEGDAAWHTPDGRSVRRATLEFVGVRPR